MEKRGFAVFLMVACTLFTSIAQVFYKIGALRLPEIITNYHILIGLILYGIGALILVTAFKFGEVTLLYPIIATSYIWVSILSWIVFSETIRVFKWFGIAFIIAGITVIALGSKKKGIIDYVDVA
jgi:drug/metabolite transporter (DMT)-like permease